ncbi:ATP-dependent DNA helicase RecG [bacterium]|nr:ATP-dependent DNA helicase RecG [bacterium]
MSDTQPLETPLQFLRGVGPQRAELFARLGLLTVRDLLFYLPRDVLDLTQVSAVHELNDERVHTVRGEVVDRDARQISGGRTLTAVLLKTDGGFVRGSWFNQPYMLHKLQLGQRVLFSAQPKFRERRWEFSHPQVQWLDEDDRDSTPGILPRYGLTEGLTMRDVRRATTAAVEDYATFVVDLLPENYRATRQLPHLSAAVANLHTPATMEAYQTGRHRLLFDDLFEFQLAIAMRRRLWQIDSQAFALPCTAKIDARIRRLFPFRFTAGQDQAIAEIIADLAQPRAMHRLLQADVGAGKTAIAVYAMLVAVANQTQAVIMAPTEILAQQHWLTVDRLLQQSRVERRLLTGQLTSKQRQTVLEEIASGEVQLVIGTQAVIQKDVHFQRLGLAVIDEQHKFGVGQRSHFAAGEQTPHMLVMTATPIPRSLCLTQFGDLDLTSIAELPPGRQRIVTTRIAAPAAVSKAWDFIREKVRQGRQAYVVCPRVESEDDDQNTSAAEAVYRDLTAGELQDFRVGLVHGRQPRDERQATMEAFRDGDLQVLVATTVIEVGVDVPNASLMVICQAERFGLSQLHQLRGRIGRGNHQAYCFLWSSTDQPDAVRRLIALESSTDGFHIAEVDFELRGPGDVLGTRQHGALPLRVANLSRDGEILVEARSAAFELVDSGEFDQPEFAPLKNQVLDRFRKLMDLPQTG